MNKIPLGYSQSSSNPAKKNILLLKNESFDARGRRMESVSIRRTRRPIFLGGRLFLFCKQGTKKNGPVCSLCPAANNSILACTGNSLLTVQNRQRDFITCPFYPSLLIQDKTKTRHLATRKEVNVLSIFASLLPRASRISVPSCR